MEKRASEKTLNGQKNSIIHKVWRVFDFFSVHGVYIGEKIFFDQPLDLIQSELKKNCLL